MREIASFCTVILLLAITYYSRTHTHICKHDGCTASTLAHVVPINSSLFIILLATYV